MDQMASSLGGVVHIDFADPANPLVEPIAFDMAASGHVLCIVDSLDAKGDHVHPVAGAWAPMRVTVG